MQAGQQYHRIRTKEHPSLALNVALSFVAGYVDTVGFIALFGLFTAHITGNLVLLGAEMATPEHSFPLLKMLALPAFLVGVALAAMFTSLCRIHAWNALRFLCLMEVMLLAAFIFAGLIAGPLEENVSAAAALTGCIAAVTMGMHSACGCLLLPNLAPTTMMTGNVTQCMIEFIGFIQGRGRKRRWKRCETYLWPIVSFGVAPLSQHLPTSSSRSWPCCCQFSSSLSWPVPHRM